MNSTFGCQVFSLPGLSAHVEEFWPQLHRNPWGQAFVPVPKNVSIHDMDETDPNKT